MPEVGSLESTQSALQAALAGNPNSGGAGTLGMNTAMASQMSRSIHVGNLTPNVTDDILRGIFGCLGEITEIRKGVGAKYGFIDFKDAETANTALGLDGNARSFRSPTLRAQ